LYFPLSLVSQSVHISVCAEDHRKIATDKVFLFVFFILT